MGLFSKKKKGVVWRDKSGKIACPGDSCPMDCDNSCPIYLNTQAITLMQLGEGPKAIPIYEEALKIAPDFYDAYNNLGGIYGQMGNIQKAYDSYKKARELNQSKPNPVYGLMLSSRDLKKYEECLSWCDVYQELSSDGREKPIRAEAKRAMGNRSGSDSYYAELAEGIIDEMVTEYPDINEYFDAEKLCDDIIRYCRKQYSDIDKRRQEFLVSSFYAALCLAIHNMKDPESYSKSDAFQFLNEQCDTEFMDVYSDRLLGYQPNSEDSNCVWEVFHRYLSAALKEIPDDTEPAEKELRKMMIPALAIGIASAHENYFPSDEPESDYVGEYIDAVALAGRNFYHYTNGIIDAKQPVILETTDIYDDEVAASDCPEENQVYRTAPLSAFIPRSCWIKKTDSSEDERESKRLLVIELENETHVKTVTEIAEVYQHVGGSMIMIPGVEMPIPRYYEIEEDLSEESDEEMEALLMKRVLPQGFSFIGKRLPQEMIDEGGNGGSDTNYTYALQSAYRRAYMHMSIDTTSDGVIEDFEYSTYQSTGSGYWDMFSRPQELDERHDEIVDMLLYIIDKYSAEEYAEIIGKSNTGK